MKTKAILTEGRREIILYLEKRNDKWASSVKVYKEAKRRLGYGGTLKALKEMYEEGFIEHFDFYEGEEKPRFIYRCRQDLSGFKKLTKAVIDSGDVTFFLKYVSFPYFKKWCNPLIDEFRPPQFAEMLQDTIQFSPSAVRLLLLPEVKDILQASHYHDIEKHFSEKYPEIKDDDFLKIIIGCVIQDYLTGSEEIKKKIKNNCIGIRVPFTDEELNERLKELESENTKKSKKKS